MRAGKLLSTMVWTFMALLVAFSISGCAKKTVVQIPSRPSEAPPTTTGPAPALTLTVSPSTIEKGQSATLTWDAKNAQSVTIDPLGPVPTAGSRTVSPETSTTYMGKATAPNQSPAERTARLTVTAISDDPSGRRERPGPDESNPLPSELTDIHFDYDRYDIRPEDQTILRQNANLINKKYTTATIVVQGHCDERGTEEYNQALGDRRATATKEYLTKLGVPASRMNTVSFGESKPLDPGHNEAAWAKNRRAHFEPR